ncbi:MAG TPA: ADP-ribosyltransferase [Patescibacteria group bacterium]|nr:ADP-ribosyltransferase [Patescibacteria group bacterium]
MQNYIEFITEEDVKLWIDAHYSKFIDDIQNNIGLLERNYADIVYEYGGNAYKVYNDLLRVVDGRNEIIQANTEVGDFKEFFSEIDILKKSILQNKLNDNIVVYRYVKLKLSKIFWMYTKAKEEIMIERGFMSTTLLPYCTGMVKLRERENYNVLFKVYVPKSTPSIPLFFNEKLTLLKEYEMLFLPNTKVKLIKKFFNFNARIPVFEFLMIND